jgi:hypothetical protein
MPLIPDSENDKIKPQLIFLHNLISDSIKVGEEIIDWDLQENNDGDEILPAILLYREILEIADATSILISKSSVEPCKILLRSLVEINYSLEYLLSGDINLKSQCFLVWQANKTLKFCDQFDLEKQTGKQSKNNFSKDKSGVNVDKYFVSEKLNQARKSANSIINLESYKTANEEYKLCKKKLKSNFSWYSMFDGPRNIEDLANRLNNQLSYQILYRVFSSNVHGSGQIQGKLLPNENGTANLASIRLPFQAQMITQHICNTLLSSHQTFIKARIPNKLQNFNKWYLEKYRTNYTYLLDNKLIQMKNT